MIGFGELVSALEVCLNNLHYVSSSPTIGVGLDDRKLQLATTATTYVFCCCTAGYCLAFLIDGQ